MSFNFINDTVEHIKRLPIDYFKNLDTVYFKSVLKYVIVSVFSSIFRATINLDMSYPSVVIR